MGHRPLSINDRTASFATFGESKASALRIHILLSHIEVTDPFNRFFCDYRWQGGHSRGRRRFRKVFVQKHFRVSIVIFAELPGHPNHRTQHFFPSPFFRSSMDGARTAYSGRGSHHIFSRKCPLSQKCTMMPVGVHLIPPLPCRSGAFP